MIRPILLTGVFAVVLATAGPASAQTYSWNNSSGGDWNVGTNWSGGAVPGSGQNALIDLAGTYTVSVSDNFNRSVGAVTVNNSGTTLERTGTTDLTSSGLFSLQAGTLKLTGGRVLTNAGLTTAAGTTINLDGGQLWANPILGGTAVINGTVDWSSGQLHGPGSTTATFPLNGPVNLIGTGTRTIESRGLTQLNGGGTWDGGRLIVDSFTKNFELPAGATITNTTASGDFSLDGGGSVGSVFNLKGTFIKQGTNESRFWQTQVNNTGLLDVQAGTMRLLGPGTHTGVFQVASGATLEFGAGQMLTSGRLTVAGTGTLAVGWVGNTSTIASAVTVDISPTATVSIANGGLDLPSNANLSPATLGVSSGRLTVLGTTSPNNLTVGAGGEIWGGTQGGVNNDLSVGRAGGTFTWEAGQFAYLRNVNINGPASLPGTGTRDLVGKIGGVGLTMTFNQGGTWDAGEIKLNGASGIVIPAGATVTNTTASGAFAIDPPDATADGGFVTIQGTFIKQGANTTMFGRSISIQNSGLVDIRQGTVVVTAPITSSGGGDYTLASGTTLQVPQLYLGGGASPNKGLLQGVGTLTLTPSGTNAGVLAVTAGGQIQAGTGGTPGVLTINGTNSSGISSFVNITAHDDTLGGPPRLIVAAQRTGAGTADAGRIDVTGTGIVNLNFPGLPTDGRYLDLQVVGTGLRLNETYTLTVMTAGGGFQRNTSTPLLGAGYVFPQEDYRLFGNFPAANNVKLYLSDAHTLSLQFTPVPEPAAVLGIGFAGLGVAGLLRRRFRRASFFRGTGIPAGASVGRSERSERPPTELSSFESAPPSSRCR
jgi:hypothetical protein